MEKIKEGLFFALGGIYLPQELLQNTEPKILHISDSPRVFYSAIPKLLKKLNPHYIIHTGDLVDNIKLNIYPDKLPEYKNDALKILRILETSSAQEIFLALGNHDHLETLENAETRCKIVTGDGIINIAHLQLKISHYYQDLINSPCKFNLYGHDITKKSSIDQRRVFLNGLESINIITLYSEKVYTLAYPLGTNDARLGKFKFGI